MKEKWLIIGAFAAIYIIWGSTYLANYYAIQDIPPLLMAGARFFVAGLILLTWLKISGTKWPKFIQARNAVFMGILFITIGNGLLVLALQYIDSGITALVIAFNPLFIILAMWVLQGITPGIRNIFGTILGIIGMAILIGQPNFTSDANVRLGLIFIGISMVSWTIASIYLSKIDLPKGKGMGAAIQMTGGGLLLLIYSFIISEHQELHFDQIGLKAGLSWIYLVTFGSIIAFSSFNYLLLKVSPDKVSTSTFVNPIVAMFLGWAFNNEIITLQSLIAAIILLSGVIFITRHKSKAR